MRWLRSRTQLGTWSALFALTIQIALSFGHLHLDGRHQSGAVPLALHWLIRPAATLPDAYPAPAPHKPANSADNFCAICAVMRSAGVPVALPALPLPAWGGHSTIESKVDVVVAASPDLFFHARGPPAPDIPVLRSKEFLA
jgi:hypothetical protein